METAEAYDSLPYPSKFFILTNPDRLAAQSRLLGVDSAAPDKCRVLELGCGNGSNLVAHAFLSPGSEFVGIDISPKHIEAADSFVERLGISNASVHCTDLMELSADSFGKFDYIVAHGLISWIPEQVRQRVFDVFNELLEPNGIGYISYNAYPGCYYRDMVRGIFRYHTRDVEAPVERVQQSLILLSKLAEYSTERKIIAQVYKHELERHFRHSTSDIYHDDLADEYRPLFFHEFNSYLEGAGMQFLCEAEYHAMSSQGFPQEVRELAESSGDFVVREQYLDFFRGRIFRQSMFCRREVSINRDVEADALEGFLVASAIKPKSQAPDLSGPAVEKFEGPRGLGIEIDHPLTKTALVLLGNSWGRAVPVKELLAESRKILESNGYQTDDWGPHFDTAKAILLRIFEGTDLITLHLVYPDAVQEVSERPCVNDLARWQLDVANDVTTLFGLNVSLADPVSRRLMELMDGTRGPEDLYREMHEFISTEDDIEDREQLLKDLRTWIADSAQELGRLGMFSG